MTEDGGSEGTIGGYVSRSSDDQAGVMNNHFLCGLFGLVMKGYAIVQDYRPIGAENYKGRAQLFE
jgi:hypothetical protein